MLMSDFVWILSRYSHHWVSENLEAQSEIRHSRNRRFYEISSIMKIEIVCLKYGWKIYSETSKVIHLADWNVQSHLLNMYNFRELRFHFGTSHHIPCVSQLLTYYLSNTFSSRHPHFQTRNETVPSPQTPYHRGATPLTLVKVSEAAQEVEDVWRGRSSPPLSRV